MFSLVSNVSSPFCGTLQITHLRRILRTLSKAQITHSAAHVIHSAARIIHSAARIIHPAAHVIHSAARIIHPAALFIHLRNAACLHADGHCLAVLKKMRKRITACDSLRLMHMSGRNIIASGDMAQ